jgi:hypothetical protein
LPYWYKKKLDIVADIFQQANLGKSFDKKKTFSLGGDFRCIPNQISCVYALFSLWLGVSVGCPLNLQAFFLHATIFVKRQKPI